MPYHKLLDCLEEDRLADKKFGSTRRGISPAYSDKYMKKALRMGDLRDREALRAHLADILEVGVPLVYGSNCGCIIAWDTESSYPVITRTYGYYGQPNIFRLTLLLNKQAIDNLVERAIATHNDNLAVAFVCSLHSELGSVVAVLGKCGVVFNSVLTEEV